MKKTLLVASLLAIALTACGKKDEAPAPADTTPPAAAPAAPETAPAPAAPETAPAAPDSSTAPAAPAAPDSAAPADSSK